MKNEEKKMRIKLQNVRRKKFWGGWYTTEAVYRWARLFTALRAAFKGTTFGFTALNVYSLFSYSF